MKSLGKWIDEPHDVIETAMGNLLFAGLCNLKASFPPIHLEESKIARAGATEILILISAVFNVKIYAIDAEYRDR